MLEEGFSQVAETDVYFPSQTVPRHNHQINNSQNLYVIKILNAYLSLLSFIQFKNQLRQRSYNKDGAKRYLNENNGTQCLRHVSILSEMLVVSESLLLVELVGRVDVVEERDGVAFYGQTVSVLVLGHRVVDP